LISHVWDDIGIETGGVGREFIIKPDFHASAG
jgi:hypothetical protein